jgi:predicted ATPase/DNA-binding XRE family transcriptional regulator
MVQSSTIADLVRRFRADAKLSQEALAERAGLSTRTISDIENGVARWPRAITLSLLAEALQLEDERREALRAAARPRAASTQDRSAIARPEAPKLIGHEVELAWARDLLVVEKARLISLVGGAGVGKTALAFALAHEVAPHFADNVIVVELAGLPDAALVPTKVALAAGVRDVRGESTTASIAAGIGQRPTLLIFDTFEHLSVAAAFVAELLAATPALSILVTSRVPLHVRSERIVPVRPLSLPPKDLVAATSELAGFSAIRLLVERAQGVKPEFQVTDDNVAGVVALVRALDGVPLAIELAAPLLRVQSPATLAARLDRALNVLVAEHRDLPHRQQTMRGAIAWSYELLSDEQQRALRRLAVFPAAFTAEAAQRTTSNDDEPDALAMLRTIAALADHSFVRVVADGEGEPRFELPPLVREYAAELLEHGEREAAQKHLAGYCLEVFENATPRALVHDRSRLDRLGRESATFDSALSWALSTRQVALGLSLVVKLRDLWWVHGACAHGYAWLRSFLELAEEDSVALDDGLLANVYWAAAGLCEAAGDLNRASEYGQKALPYMRARGDRKAIASLLSGSGVLANEQGDYASARLRFEEGLSIRREIGDRALIAQSLCDLGLNTADEGNYALATTIFEEALEHFRVVGSELGVSGALAGMAIVAARSGAMERAETLARESLRVATEIRYVDGIIYSSVALGRALLARGEAAGAESIVVEVVRTTDVGTLSGQAPSILRLLARIQHQRDNPGEAARLLGAASSVANDRIAPAERQSHEAFVAAVEAALGPTFDAEFTVGRAAGARNALAALSSTQVR